MALLLKISIYLSLVFITLYIEMNLKDKTVKNTSLLMFVYFYFMAKRVCLGSHEDWTLGSYSRLSNTELSIFLVRI